MGETIILHSFFKLLTNETQQTLNDYNDFMIIMSNDYTIPTYWLL